MQDLHTRKEAAAYLQGRGLPVTEGSLDQLVSRGDGPEYAIVLSKAVYRQSALDNWIDRCLERTGKRRQAPREPIAA